MESQQQPDHKVNPSEDDQQEKGPMVPSAGHVTRLSSIDTSSPFRSVKEAVEIFGERFLARDIYSTTPKPPFTIPKEDIVTSTNTTAPSKPFSPSFSSTSSAPKLEHGNDFTTKNMLKKLETELRETKHELKLIKERESEMEIVVASLRDELHKNMSKVAECDEERVEEKDSDVSKATKSTATSTPIAMVPRGNRWELLEEHDEIVNVDQDDHEYMYLKSLAEVLSLGETEGYFGKKKKKKKQTHGEMKMMNMKKVKPIIPLVTDLIS